MDKTFLNTRVFTSEIVINRADNFLFSFLNFCFQVLLFDNELYLIHLFTSVNHGNWIIIFYIILSLVIFLKQISMFHSQNIFFRKTEGKDHIQVAMTGFVCFCLFVVFFNVICVLKKNIHKKVS